MHAFIRFFSGLAGRSIGGFASSFIRACLIALPLLFVGGLSQAQTFYDSFSHGTGGVASIIATTTDSAGNSYALGNFSSTGGALTGAGMSLTPVGTYDGFIAKFNASGALIWAHNFGGPGVTVNVGGLALDASGNVYAGGSFYGGSLTAPAVTKISTTNSSRAAPWLTRRSRLPATGTCLPWR
jgi:hypothetical protein